MSHWVERLRAQGVKSIVRGPGSASARARAQAAWERWCARAQRRLERTALGAVCYIPGRGWHASEALAAGRLAETWARSAGGQTLERETHEALRDQIYEAAQAHVHAGALKEVVRAHDTGAIERGAGRIEALRETHEDPPGGWQVSVAAVEAAGQWSGSAWATVCGLAPWVAREAIDAGGHGAIDVGKPGGWLAERAYEACRQARVRVPARDAHGEGALRTVLEQWKWKEVRPPLACALACALEGGGAPDQWGWGIAKIGDETRVRKDEIEYREYAHAVHRMGAEERSEIEALVEGAGGTRPKEVEALERAWGRDPVLGKWSEGDHPVRLVAHGGGQMAWYIAYASAKRLALGTDPKESLGGEMARHEGVRVNVGWTMNRQGWSWERRRPGDEGPCLGEAIDAIVGGLT